MKYVGEYTKEISFPIGGIGTGSIGLSGDGRLIDWEIFNRPSKGSFNGYSHFAIRAFKGDKIIPLVMSGDIDRDYIGPFLQKEFLGFGHGPDSRKMYGFPHFSSVEFSGEFPIAEVEFKDGKFPANVKLSAFNPFIPSDAKNSSIPAAFFEVEVENTSEEEVTYQVALSVGNPYMTSRNTTQVKDGCRCITFLNSSKSVDEIGYGELTVATDCEKSRAQTYWCRGESKDNVVLYWDEFSNKKELSDRRYDTDGEWEYMPMDTGTLVAEVKAAAGETKKARFVLSWNIPNQYNYWDECKDEAGNHKKWKNYYATIFENSIDSATYSLKNWDSLYSRTKMFKDALHSSTLPEAVIDAASASLSVLKSPTVMRLEDGSFYGWEGVHEQAGSCEGTCQHVWNYAYAMCFLFPELERSIRDLEFKYSTAENGRMGFRLRLPLGREITDFRACVDGQMGAVIKCYREWKISGDNKWLADNWDNIKKVLEYAWSSENPDKWDVNKCGVIDGRQHHTLDREFFGPNSWLEGMYLAALSAAVEMGEFLGDFEKAAEYRDLFEKGYKWTKENLFNGKYFVQKVDVNDKNVVDRFDAAAGYWNDEIKQVKYQICEGSLIDQMLAQWHADINGLGRIYDKEQISSALSEMMKNNFKTSMRDFVNPWRLFSVNDESGTVICVYPEGAYKPKIPVLYCEETMTGFEYSFAGLLCSQGRVEDGIKVVKAVRDRFDGKKRNPWNEYECGSNYARSMSSYALIPILSGFEFDMPYKHLGFNPYIKNEFKTIWSIDGAWGEFELIEDRAVFSLFEGGLSLTSFGVKFFDKVSDLKIDGKSVDFRLENGIIYFEETNITQNMEIIR